MKLDYRKVNLNKALKRIRKVTPRFLWTKCKDCENLFKKEPMWKYIRFDEMNHFFCMECRPNRMEILAEYEPTAYKYFKEQ